MKQLSCEMCGSANIIKQEGLFVCQTCGTKYSVEEARKMMTGETVEVEGTVKIDQSEELKNLYILARREKEQKNYIKCQELYEQILLKDPNSWEAIYCIGYSKGAGTSINYLKDSWGLILDLIKSNVSESEQEKIINSIFREINLIAQNSYKNRKKFFKKKGMIEKRKRSVRQGHINNLYFLSKTYYSFGDNLIKNFEGKYSNLAIECWEKGVEIHQEYIPLVKDKKLNKKQVDEYLDKIKKYR